MTIFGTRSSGLTSVAAVGIGSRCRAIGAGRMEPAGFASIHRRSDDVAFLFRMCGIALLLLALLNPQQLAERPRPRANLFPIVVDQSKA